MTRKSFSVIMVLLILAINALGQNNREEVYVHLNSQALVAGESLLMSAYCRSQLTGSLSQLSKVVYVEIIGSSGSIYQQKLELKNGRGSSEFFISSLIPTGKYYLVAYTRWMKNFNDYFKSPIEIINPFEPGPLIERSDEERLEVEFFIDNSQPVAGVKNTIGFKIISPIKNPESFKGKVISSSGESLTTFSHDAFGIGSFDITPQYGESYKMILEDELGNIKFFDVPQASERGVAIRLKIKNKILAVDLQSKGLEETTGTLRLYNKNMLVLEQLVGLNSNTVIDLKNIEGELFSIQILDSNNKVYVTRNLYNPRQSGSSSLQANGSYPTRSSVVLNLALKPGNYSISVRRKNQYLSNRHTRAITSSFLPVIDQAPLAINEYFSNPLDLNIEAFLLGTTFRQVENTSELKFLPDFRNEFIDGKLLSKDKTPVANEILLLTVFTEPFSILTTKTDNGGNFSIPFESLYRDTEAVVTPVSLDSTYTIELLSPFLSSHEKYDYTLPSLDSNQVMEVVAKSIRSQIENAYYTADTASRPQTYLPTQIDYNKTYVLDDYTRFNTLQETFLEYIPGANIRERRIPVLKPYSTSVPEYFQKAPLILLDGVPVSDKRILEFSTSNIERIELLNSRYFLGPLVSDGIINFTTFEGKMGRFKRANYHKFTTLRGLDEDRPFKSISHDSTSPSKLPDQRDQLYWNPNIKVVREGSYDLSFYTSDVTGDFEIIVEGFQKDGTPVSMHKTFSVTQPPKP